MFFYIGIFVAVILLILIIGYVFFPNSQFSLTTSKKYFVITIVILSFSFPSFFWLRSLKSI